MEKEAGEVKSYKDLDGFEKYKYFNAFEYYKFAREEIMREDELTNHRVSSSLTLQGFLLATVGILLQSSDKIKLETVYLAFIFAAGAIGLLLSIFSYRGVAAARRSIRKTRDKWYEVRDRHGITEDIAPKLIADGRDYKQGSDYSTSVPAIMILAWASYLVFFVFHSILT